MFPWRNLICLYIAVRVTICSEVRLGCPLHYDQAIFQTEAYADAMFNIIRRDLSSKEHNWEKRTGQMERENAIVLYLLPRKMEP